MAIELICPTCRKRLRVPDGAAGRNARCPACSGTVKVPARPRTIVKMDPASQVAEEPPWFDESGWAPVEGIAFRTVWEHAVKTWKERVAGLAGGILAVVLLAVPLQGGILAGLYFADQALNNSSSGLESDASAIAMRGGMALLAVLLMAIVSAGVSGAAALMWIDAARGKTVQLGRILDVRHCVVACLGFTIWYGIVSDLGFILLVIPGLWYSVTRWPAFFFIVDKNQGVFEALANAKRATQGNFGTSFLVLLVASLLATGGVLLAGIGVLFLGPLAGVLMASAYLYMAGQFKQDEVLDPYAERARRAKEKKEEPAPSADTDDLPEFA